MRITSAVTEANKRLSEREGERKIGGRRERAREKWHKKWGHSTICSHQINISKGQLQ